MSKRDNEKHDALMNTGACAFSAIAEMVAALQCDYDRLEELREERKALAGCDQESVAVWEDENGEELKELEAAAGDCESREDAEQRIQEDPLEIQVNHGWTSPGEKPEAPEEFRILLSTGGPATRICGDLDEHGQPTRAYLQVQDWFTPWTDYTKADSDALLTYAQQFYFGEG